MEKKKEKNQKMVKKFCFFLICCRMNNIIGMKNVTKVDFEVAKINSNKKN